MTGKQWRAATLTLFYWHVLTSGVPGLLDLLGPFWGPVTAPVFGILAAGAILVPLKPDKAEQHDKVDT